VHPFLLPSPDKPKPQANSNPNDITEKIYDDVSHEVGIPRSLRNPSIHPPEMMGNVKLSSNDPRSRRFINISGKINFNQGRDIPSASATPLTRPATTEINNKPNKPPAPVLVCKPPISCLTPPCHAQEISRPPLRMGAMKPQNPKAAAAPVTAAAVKPARDLRGASGRRRKGRRAGSLRVFDP